MSIKGFPTQQKLLSNSNSHAQFVTTQPMDSGLRYGLDTVTRFLFRVDNDLVPRTAGANTGNPSDGSGTIVYDTATPAKVGDVVRFEDGNAQFLEIPIAEVSTNYFKLAAKLSADLLPAAGDTFYIMRYATQRVDETGSQSVVANPGPSQFVQDGLDVEVEEDTGTPANSKPFPVKMLNGSGNEVPFPTSLGQKTSANSFAVVIASDQSAVPASQSGTWNINNVSGTVSLPTGAATEAKQDAGNLSLDSIDTKLNSQATALYQQNQITELQDIEADVEAMSAKLPATLGQKAAAASMSVVLASDQGAVPASQSGTWNINNISGTVSLPTGAATEAKQDAEAVLVGAVNETAPASDTASSGLNGRLQRIAQRITSLIALLPASLGQKTMANSFAVTMASDQSALNVQQAGRTKVGILRNDYSSTSVTTSAYTQLTASTSATTNRLQIFDSSGQSLVLAVGAAASEVDQIYIFPGGNGDVELTIASGSRISVKAVSATASSGELLINLLS